MTYGPRVTPIAAPLCVILHGFFSNQQITLLSLVITKERKSWKGGQFRQIF